MAADDIDFTCEEALARHDDEILRSEFRLAITRRVELEGLARHISRSLP